MNRIQRYHRRHDRLALAVAIVATAVFAAFDALVVVAYFA